MIDIGSLEAVESGQYDQEYLREAGKASNFRKEFERLYTGLKTERQKPKKPKRLAPSVPLCRSSNPGWRRGRLRGVRVLRKRGKARIAPERPSPAPGLPGTREAVEYRQAFCPVCGRSAGRRNGKNAWEKTKDFDPDKPFGVIQDIGQGFGIGGDPLFAFH